MADAKGAASTVADTLGGLSTWAIVLLAVVGVALIVAAIVMLVRRRKPPSPASGASKPGLAGLWHRYLAKLADRLPSARFYPVAVVMGAARAGKTHLVGRADWEALQKQGLPSEPGDARLPRYCGRGVLVQEVAWDVLNDTDGGARQLEELWRPFAHQAPTVVVVVDAARLQPDDLKGVADALRGKLDIIARVRRAAVPIRLCLTHLDQIEGYADVVGALGDRRDGLVLTIDRPVDQKAPIDAATIERCFEPLKGALPRVLVERPTPALRRAVAFFTARVPAIARGLEPFLRELLAPGQAAPAPTLEGIYLGALDSAEQTGNPFVVDATSAEAAALAWRRRQVATGGAIVGAAVAASAAFTIALNVYHYRQIEAAERAVDALVKGTQAALAGDRRAGRRVEDDESAAGERVRAFVSTEASWWLLRGTFESDKKWTRARFLNAVRSYYLLPALRDARQPYRTLHAAALVYAAPTNPIGHDLVLADVPRWADVVGLPQAVVLDYAQLSPATWNDSVTIPPQPPGSTVAATSLDAWGAYLDELGRVFAAVRPEAKAAALEPTSLNKLKDKNAQFLSVLEEAKHDEEARRVAAALVRVAPVDRREIDALLPQSDVSAWVNDNRPALTGLLGLVRDASIDVTPPAKASLLELMTALAAGPASNVPDATYTFKLKQQWFSFATKLWVESLAHARAAVLVDAFLRSHRRDADPRAYAFFADPAAYPAVGAAALRGKGPSASLAGIYTRDAFRREVAPAFDAYAAQIDQVSLSSRDRGRLKRYVQGEVDHYAAAYRDALTAYYGSFQLSAPSAPVLRAMLAELTLPSSWLADFLRTVAENANLELKDGELYARMGQALEGYRAIVALLAEQKGQYPNLERYVSFLSPLVTVAPAGGGDKGPGLADVLSPTGRSALSMLHEDKDSVFLQVEPWLVASGIGPAQRAPFLLPVQLSYDLGVGEIEQAVGDAWRRDLLAELTRFSTLFPFDGKAEDEASPADIESFFLPEKGRFWQWFAAMLKPVCAQVGGRYASYPSSRRAPRLPKGSLATINDVAQMGALLWDKAGKPQPLALSVRSRPLSPPAPGGAPTLATLLTGKASFFGFNQMATWQRLDLTWWEEDTSAIELEISAPGSGRKRYLRTEVVDSMWSFHRLLARAKTPRFTWALPDAPNREKVVSFEVRGDPWAPFRLRVTP